MNPVIDSIHRWRRKEISGTSLMRALASYPEWNVPVSESAAAEMLATNAGTRIQTSKLKDGKTCLLLYSSAEAYKTYCAAQDTASTQTFLTTLGTWVFRLPFEELDEIHIDPFTDYDIFWPKELFPRLRDMAEAVDIENAILGLRQGTAPDGSCRCVRDYKNFYLPLAYHEGRPRLLMAPDSKNRSLAAIFTADDTFDAFTPQARELSAGQPVKQAQFDGASLFGILQNMQLDGIVFNCAGPVTPVAFAPGFAQVVLES